MKLTHALAVAMVLTLDAVLVSMLLSTSSDVSCVSQSYDRAPDTTGGDAEKFASSDGSDGASEGLAAGRRSSSEVSRAGLVGTDSQAGSGKTGSKGARKARGGKAKGAVGRDRSLTAAAAGTGVEEEGDGPYKGRRLRPGVRVISREDFEAYRDAVVESPEEEPAKQKQGIIAGYVVDEEGAPIAGALVTLSLEMDYLISQLPEDGDLSKFPKEVTTDPNGQFWFSNLYFTSYSVKVECKGYLTEYFAAIRLDEKGEVYLQVVMRNNLVITGVVVDENDNPVQGAKVTATYSIEVGPDFVSETYSDSHGEFALPVREGSSNRVEASKIGYRPASLLSVPPGTTDCRLVLAAIPAGTIKGRVVDGSTGLPVVEITIDGESIYASDGYFEIERQVSSQTQTLVIGAQGYLYRTVQFSLRESGTIDLGEISLQVELLLRGMVMVADTEPPQAVAGASVRLGYDGKAPRTTTSAGDGTFVFEGIAPGTPTLTVTAKGFYPETRLLSIENYDPENPASREVYVLVHLAPGGHTVTGTVTDSQTSSPIENARLEVVEAPASSALSGSNGKYSIEGVPVSTFRVRASKEGYASSTSEPLSSEVRGSTITCDFKLDPGGFSGVLLRSGSPVPEGVGAYLWKKVSGPIDARLVADSNLNENRRSTTTEKEGRFSFEKVPDGDYYLVVPEYHLWPLAVTVDSKSCEPVSIELPGVSEIRGRITYADGLPVANTTLYLHSGENDYSMAAYHTDEQGNYVVKNVPLGSYALSIIKSIADQSAQHVVQFAVTNAPVHVMDVSLPSLKCLITGRVTDEDGNPKPGIQVGVEYLDSVHREILAGWVLTDAQGRYSVPRLEAGRHVVRTAWTEDEVIFSDIVELKDGESKEVNLVAPRITGKSISGNLVTADGAPLAGSFVFAIDSNGKQSGNFFANFDWGYARSFRINGLKPGNYTLVFTSTGCKKKSVSVSVNSNMSGFVVVMERE